MSDVALQALFEQGRLWRGQGSASPRSTLSTGFAELDAVLPGGGWPGSALNEILIPADGVGELQLLWPLLARLSAQGGRIVLVAPPYIPFAPAWAAAGIALARLQVVQTDDERNAMWVAEQCLRSAACAAVVCWPRQADQRILRRLQLAAETGASMGFALRPANVASQPSMAAVRVLIETDPVQWRVLKCRGGNPPARAVPFPLQSTMLSRAARRSLPLSPGSGESAKGEGETLRTCASPQLSVAPAPSPAPEADGGVEEQPGVLTCRGGSQPAHAIPLPSRHSGAARVVCGQNPTAEAGCRSERRRSRWPAGRAAGCGEFIQQMHSTGDSGFHRR